MELEDEAGKVLPLSRTSVSSHRPNHREPACSPAIISPLPPLMSLSPPLLQLKIGHKDVRGPYVHDMMNKGFLHVTQGNSPPSAHDRPAGHTVDLVKSLR